MAGGGGTLQPPGCPLKGARNFHGPQFPPARAQLPVLGGLGELVTFKFAPNQLKQREKKIKLKLKQKEFALIIILSDSI